MPTLRRVSDGAGDAGARSEIILYEGGKLKERKQGRPTVGWCILVGSVTARTYANQDYWLTTPVTEILEDTGDMVRFRTQNSEYIWTT